LTSSRREACSTQAAYFFGSFLEATNMVLAEFSGGWP
jgi:hypothetical protein